MDLSRKVVNVASIPQRSPFRYPGGKTWLVPHVRNWLRNLSFRAQPFVEPFAGGGIISLSVAFENFSDQVVMCELDDNIASVWQTVLNRNNEWLAAKILEFDVTVENVRKELALPAKSVRDRAFQTVLRNRVYHGGIMAHGSGLIKNGENGKGIKSRWYPQTLARRVRDIQTIQKKIDFVNGDGIQLIKEQAQSKEAVFFIDPPYTAGGKMAGKRLYQHNELNHEELFELIASFENDFLMTYDNSEEIGKLAQRFGFDTEAVAMKNTHHATMTELLIGRNLDWTRKYAGKQRTQKELF